MDKKPDFKHEDQWLKDMPLTKNAAGFSAEQMINCEKCSRQNAPNRLNCMYCGEALPISAENEANISPRLRRLETWEKSFNIIILPNGLIYDDAKYSDVSKLLRIEAEDLRKIVETNKPLPIARCDTFYTAEKVGENLMKLGVSAKILSDEDLHVETQTRRLRSIEILADRLKLRLFNIEETHEILLEDLALIVTGAVFERKISATERYNKKDENKTLQSSEMSNDEPIIDIYSKNDSIGYRIFTSGFDFSCVGEKKSLLAAENIKILQQILREISKNAKFIDDYTKIRHALGQVWETEETKDSKGLKPSSFGSFNIENITTINNLQQFTKYSRFQFQILKKGGI
jgi:hypothetical protein